MSTEVSKEHYNPVSKTLCFEKETGWFLENRQDDE
jgi:hypothetical protein